jgi:enoyl-CoA hydratase
MAGGVAIERRDAIAICRIASPETNNALSPALMDALADGLEQLDRDPEVRCIIVAGSDDVFATGADAASLGGVGHDPLPGALTTTFWNRLDGIATPLVAAVSGWALGSGCELAFGCDLVVASKTARFGQPEITLGLIPGGGATQRLTRILGKQRTMELVLTGRRMGAEQANRYGLVNTVAPKGRWMEKALVLATAIAERAPLAVQLAKQAILEADRKNLAEGLEVEHELFVQAMASEDRVEGVKAFLAGRPPKFEGR